MYQSTEQFVHPSARKTWNVQQVDLDVGALRETVEDMLASQPQSAVSIRSLVRTPCEFATLFPIDVLHVTLASGEERRLLLKHFGQEDASHPDKDDCTLREIRIYRELFQDAELPIPKFYGDKCNEASGRHELFLEFVDGWNLKYHHLEHWFTAARRLAELHASWAPQLERLMRCDFLLRFDADYLRSWAQRALSAVAEQSSVFGKRFERLLRSYECVTTVVCAQPRTLVHNDLSPKNVIADTQKTPARICFIDWEMAGIGCGVLDLVHLKYGLDVRDAADMVAAYCEELNGSELLPSKREDFDQLLAACELHKTVYRLAHTIAWQLPIETVNQWVEECEELLDHLK